jgi:hypothetical protein
LASCSGTGSMMSFSSNSASRCQTTSQSTGMELVEVSVQWVLRRLSLVQLSVFLLRFALLFRCPWISVGTCPGFYQVQFCSDHVVNPIPAIY